jgi:hypothetical protein
VSGSFQRLVFTTAAKMFSSTYRVMVEGEGDAVGYLNPLLAIAATINVSLPGQQPDLRTVHEDSRLLNPRLADKSGKEGMPGCKLPGPSVLFSNLVKFCSYSVQNKPNQAFGVGIGGG